MTEGPDLTRFYVSQDRNNDLKLAYRIQNHSRIRQDYDCYFLERKKNTAVVFSSLLSVSDQLEKGQIRTVQGHSRYFGVEKRGAKEF
jgi:hypothetical protein